ncbi:MAG: phenylalanine--tRNA ligase subunit beta, partial [Phycisphaerales bacterium]|nr:phenylalanine--tRNA ligase subunit beta [Phycisphaerales bacterium]
MDTSVAWINDYLDRPADAEEQADVLTHAGFPLEGREDVEDDVRQDFEMTSNRGDCTCHTGLAREIAALTDRTLCIPSGDPPCSGPAADTLASVTNEVPESCPWYTGRVIRDITVSPSPESIAARLRARGDVPRSNVVDATNFVLFELGQPTHVFDLDKLAGGRIIIRMAQKGERFLPIGEDATEIELDGTEMVIADAEKPVALAGVKGGALTAVTDQTRNILVEAATFAPAMVRHTSRLHNIASDSSFRFERGVSPGQVDHAAERLCALILETAGGTLAPGVLESGASMPDRLTVTMRTQRCRDLLGLEIEDGQMVEWLARLGFEPTLDDGVIKTVVPWHRGDVEREVDLIEEVMRMHGFASVPVDDTITIRPALADRDHQIREALSAALVADGFVESITHSLIADAEAALCMPADASARRVIEARAAGVPALRPSIIPSLLRVRCHNADKGVAKLQLFELGSVFLNDASGHHEALELGLIMDITDADAGIAPLRGVIDHLAQTLAGADARVTIEPCDNPAWLSPAGTVYINGIESGVIGRLSPATMKAANIDQPVLAAAIRPAPFMSAAPEVREAQRLPEHPAIERDLSAIVPESVTWNALMAVVDACELPHLEIASHVTTWRGKGV